MYLAINTLLSFAFFFILTSSASEILDLDGDRVRPGVEYRLLQARLFNPTSISLVPSSSCPSNVALIEWDQFWPKALPVKLHMVKKDVDYFSESTKFNMRTEHADFCPDHTPVWKVGSGRIPNITGGGEIGDHKSSVFSLKKAKNTRRINAYNLFYCPEPDMMCSFATVGNSKNVIITGFESRTTPISVAFQKIRAINNV